MPTPFTRPFSPVRRQGFTLLELIVVVAIIALIMTMVSQQVFSGEDRTRAKLAETQVKTLAAAVQSLRLDIGRFPTREEGLQLLVKAPPADSPIRNRWRGPYTDPEALNDPWGTPYVFSVPGAEGKPFALYSLGADQKIGGEGVHGEIGMLPPAGQ